MSLETVKLQERKVRGVPHYSVTIPKKFIEPLGWGKGDLLVIKLVDHEGRRALLIYKPRIE